jgi:hypothetical protein
MKKKKNYGQEKLVWLNCVCHIHDKGGIGPKIKNEFFQATKN